MPWPKKTYLAYLVVPSYILTYAKFRPTYLASEENTATLEELILGPNLFTVNEALPGCRIFQAAASLFHSDGLSASKINTTLRPHSVGQIFVVFKLGKQVNLVCSFQIVGLLKIPQAFSLDVAEFFSLSKGRQFYSDRRPRPYSGPTSSWVKWPLIS